MHTLLMLAPYTDTTFFPTFDINLAPAKLFYLGFVVSDKDGDPSWGGVYKVESDFYADIIYNLRKKGGDVIVSFGGAKGVELAANTLTTKTLLNKYSLVIDRYALKSVDFDIEGSALYEKESILRRGKAVVMLKKKYPELEISLTLPVMPFGLGEYEIKCMKEIPHDILNIMAMDYGNEKDMAVATIKALNAVRKQTTKKIAVTVMIGKNDSPEIFTLENAKTLREFISKNKWIVRTSFWSIERDRGVYGPLSHSSQITQKKWEFSNLLKP